MVDKVLKALLLFSPIFYVPNMPLEKADLIFFHFSVFALFIACLFDKPKRGLIDFSMVGSFLILAIVNAFLNGFNQIILNSMINIFFGAAVIYIVAIYATFTRAHVEMMILAALINIFLLIGQISGYSPIIQNPEGQPGGMLGNSPRLMSYLTIILPLAFSYSWLTIILFPLLGYVSGEYVILVAAAILLYRDFKMPYLWLIILIIVAFTIIEKLKSSFYTRWFIWGPVIDKIFANPVRGYGLGMFPHISSQFIKLNYYADTTFSSVLQLIFAGGLSFLGWIGFYANKFLRNIDSDARTFSMIAIFMLSLVDYPFEISKLWLTIATIIGFYLIKECEKHESQIRRQI